MADAEFYIDFPQSKMEWWGLLSTYWAGTKAEPLIRELMYNMIGKTNVSTIPTRKCDPETGMPLVPEAVKQQITVPSVPRGNLHFDSRYDGYVLTAHYDPNLKRDRQEWTTGKVPTFHNFIEDVYASQSNRIGEFLSDLHYELNMVDYKLIDIEHEVVETKTVIDNEVELSRTPISNTLKVFLAERNITLKKYIDYTIIDETIVKLPELDDETKVRLEYDWLENRSKSRQAYDALKILVNEIQWLYFVEEEEEMTYDENYVSVLELLDQQSKEMTEIEDDDESLIRTIIWDESSKGKYVAIHSSNKRIAYGVPLFNASDYVVHFGSTRMNTGKQTGKWYWEVYTLADNKSFFPQTNYRIGLTTAALDVNAILGNDYFSYGLDSRTGLIYHDSIEQTYVCQVGYNNVIGVALDLDEYKIWFSWRGSWVNSGTPDSGNDPTITIPSQLYNQTWYPACTVSFQLGYVDSKLTNIFTQAMLNAHSADFVYDIPSGFQPFEQSS